jgi:nucleotide-binding universal stress UspA family protein
MQLLTVNSVLVATDLEETSWPAIRTAARLAPLAGASLHLLHVADSYDAEDATRLNAHFREAAPEAAAPESTRVECGAPAAVIVEHAIRVGADVVILGPHRGLDDTVPLGSTARSVIRTARCACLVAATELRLPLERVLAPIDVSDASVGTLSLALSWASGLRRPRGVAELIALHVTQSPDTDRECAAVRDEVARARSRAGGAAQVEIRERVVAGTDPAVEIVREAVSSSADLVVMGTRAVEREASDLGSVSAGVVREAPCPLLLVPPAVWQRADR